MSISIASSGFGCNIGSESSNLSSEEKERKKERKKERNVTQCNTERTRFLTAIQHQ
jgi:hypothetical protein